VTCGQSPTAITGTAQIVSAVTGTAQVAVAVECCSPITYDPVFVSWLPIDEEIKSSLKPWNGASFTGPESVVRGTSANNNEGPGGGRFNPGSYAPPTDGGGGVVVEM
jgi:hypothetical protein